MVELITALLFFMIIGAIIALETKDLLSSIISVGAVGFGVSIAFLFLGAPDIAITQVVVEVLVLVILIRATISRDTTTIAGEGEFFTLTIGVAMLLVIFVIGIGVFNEFPPFGKPAFTTSGNVASNTYIRKGLDETGASNLVTSVILDYRAYDTLGETTVLFTAILGTLALLRLKSRKSKTDSTVPIRQQTFTPNPTYGMSLIVQTSARWIKGLIFLFGVYIVLYGHLTPGGGFAGGVIIACAFVLMTLAFGSKHALGRLSKTVSSELDSVGALMFLIIGLSGIYCGGIFLGNFIQKNYPGQYFRLFSAGNIPLYNIAIGIKVASSLFMVFIILAVVRVVTRGDERKFIRR